MSDAAASSYTEDTITARLARFPDSSPDEVMKHLLKGPLHHWLGGSPCAQRAKHWNWNNGATSPNNQPPSTEELEFVRKQYKYATEAEGGPGELYLKLLADCMLPLTSSPLSNVVSPQIMASTGVVPLSIFSTGPDIIQHYYECIIEAKQEVVLLTNYWQQGKNVDKIASAIRELNRRTAERNTNKIVFKLMWDRGPQTVADLFRSRKEVPPNKWKQNGLPSPEELTHIDLEILNYHRPLMGTFHAKLLLVDRSLALLNSINIQDRPNLEACVHLEGDIVNAVYDHALISWGLKLHPSLPCLDKPTSPAVSEQAFVLPQLTDERLQQLSRGALHQLKEEDIETVRQEHIPMRVQLADLVDSMMSARANATDAQSQKNQESTPDSENAARRAAAVWRKKARDSQQKAQEPSSSLLPGHLKEGALRFLGKDSSSSWNVQRTRLDAMRSSELDPSFAAQLLGRITRSLDFANNSQVSGELRPEKIEQSKGGWEAQNLMGLLDFQPVIVHAPHKPVPMALVNRRPFGTPGHSDIKNPQAAAWLAGFRYAQRHVFIQSPTLNAAPVKAAILGCVRRGVRVELWLDLGFNDKSESMPFQGGTNEQVVSQLFKLLRQDGQGKEQLLEVYWYTGKDMDRPLNAVRKQRNCHVKFAAFDGRVAILGSGNQDTQSWFHSQEINVMVDSKQIVSEWTTGLRRNQSTSIYGRVDATTGIWSGKQGNQLPDTGKDLE
ncbi:hypothetical protein MPSI1_001046 [Malassezia psittaci]|uniref:PLD phosphodiesterase domain-containing protein n=1 Tax=Malassezia psittaci TaxID=1821823 RepID=A0AAF0JD83_9BASI|nr:hypothetical protein MPSI1_001046 [Malassezia psittaci]